MHVVEIVFAVIGVISIPIIAVGATFIYWVVQFLEHGDG